MLMRNALGICGLLVCVSLASAADSPRPTGTGTGDAVAKVHLVGGQLSRVKPATGVAFAPHKTMTLFRNDQLLVKPGEFLIVLLTSNNHLVRIDDDIELKVSDIVLLNAPRTNESLSSQLDRMVTVEEKRVAERIAGVYAGRSAAEGASTDTGLGGLGLKGVGEGGGGRGDGAGLGSIGAHGGGSGSGYGSGSLSGGTSKPSAAKAPARTAAAAPPKPQPAAAASPAPAPAPRPTPAPAPAPVAAPAATEAPPPPPPTAQPSPAPRAPDTDRAPSAPADSKATTAAPGGAAPGAAAVSSAAPSLNDDNALQACLAKSIAPSLRKTIGKKLTLRLHIESGRIGRIAIFGGLPTPDCARQLLVGRPHPGPEQTWHNVVLDLK